MKTLEEIGVALRDGRLIAALFMEQTTMVKINSEVTEPCLMERGVEQRCLISLVLFHLYEEALHKGSCAITRERDQSKRSTDQSSKVCN